ncbi:ABC-2 transporter permease [Miniphocaeibacter halophilus]|uniref:ABC-2 transporter permease n=1 Tax=Miniphocaeibacter halophilus TaxID=2931922 RepID=A0AC61MZX3_9FIRM|nr:ABC-2 transporter permease [Miniphocaeibacter halophilus]QQK09000.1 ABC-2 transporter permease [Miniphocaeibacter halophilus]
MKGLILYDYLSVNKKLLNKSILTSIIFTITLSVFFIQGTFTSLLINAYLLSLIAYIPMALFEDNSETDSFMRTLTFPISTSKIVLSRYLAAFLYLSIYSLIFGIGIILAIIVNGTVKLYLYPYLITIVTGILLLSLGLISNFSNKSHLINLFIVSVFVLILYLILSNFQMESILYWISNLPNYFYITTGIIIYLSLLLISFFISTKLLSFKLSRR